MTEHLTAQLADGTVVHGLVIEKLGWGVRISLLDVEHPGQEMRRATDAYPTTITVANRDIARWQRTQRELEGK